MIYYVLDQTVMRKPILHELIQSGQAASFVVPDTAFVEMAKSERWEDTMRGSFAALASAADRTFVSLSVGEAIRTELASLKPVDRASLLPQEFATCVRKLIRALTSMDGSNDLDDIERASGSSYWRRWPRRQMLLPRRKALIVSLWVWRQRADRGWRKTCAAVVRKNGKAQLGLIQEHANAMLEHDFGIEPGKAPAFGRSKPLVLRYAYLRLRHAMWWAQRRGL